MAVEGGVGRKKTNLGLLVKYMLTAFSHSSSEEAQGRTPSLGEGGSVPPPL